VFDRAASGFIPGAGAPVVGNISPAASVELGKTIFVGTTDRHKEDP
jgi:hypothetical protein